MTKAVTKAVSKQTEKNVLVGRFFHSFNEAGRIEWQGVVEGQVDEDHFLVQLFSWVMGEDSDQVIVPLTDMLKWKFYNTADAMNHAHEKQGSRDE